MQELENIVAQNLISLRKGRMWTQAELAEKINYSDKSVSKWERGEALPDLKVLKKLADLFGVTVDCFLTEGGARAPKAYMAPAIRRRLQVWLTAMALCLVWMVATTIYVYISINAGLYRWQTFVWAVPVSCLVLMLCDWRYFHRRLTPYVSSALIWSLITAIFLQWLSYNMWMLYLLGVPAQVAVLLLAQIRRTK